MGEVIQKKYSKQKKRQCRAKEILIQTNNPTYANKTGPIRVIPRKGRFMRKIR